MKIALCFSGQARSFEKGYEYYKRNLLDHYDVDVYIHTWKFDEEDKLNSLYNPKVFKSDEPIVGDFDNIYKNSPNPEKHPPRFTHSMLYSMYQSSQLLESSQVQYDWVIKSRTDYALNLKIPFEEFDNTKLYIPNCRMVPERNFGNDQFAFSSQENMMKYMSTYNEIDRHYTFGVQFIGEDMMRENLLQHGLHGEQLVYVDMNNPFPPGNYNGTWHSLIRDDIERWKNS
jgi:hypothetical protein